MDRYAYVPSATVAQLIEELSKFPPDFQVVAYNGDCEEMSLITGLLYLEDAKTIEICTDDP